MIRLSFNDHPKYYDNRIRALKVFLMPNLRTTHFQRMEKKSYNKTAKKTSFPLRAGFEPTRENPIEFQVQRLNHSAIAAESSK